jgi:chromosome segregation ATPase
MESMKDATELMGQNVRGVRQIFCLHPKNPKAGIRLGRTGGADLGSTPIRAWDGNPRMLADREEMLRYEKDLLQAERLACQSGQQELQSKQQHQSNCQKELVQLEKALQAQNKRINTLEGELGALQDGFSEANPKAGVLDALQARLAEAKESLENFTRAYEDSVTAKDGIDADQAETMKEIDAITASINTVTSKLRKAEATAKRRDDAKQQKLLERNGIAPKLRAIENDKAAKQSSLDAAKAAVVAIAAEAEKISPRVAIPRTETVSSLERKRTRLDEDLTEAERE